MKKILIMGMGKSGTWAARLALREGYRCLLYDDRDLAVPGTLEKPLSENPNVSLVRIVDDSFLKQIDEVIMSPGFSPDHPVRTQVEKTGCRIISEIEFAARFCNGKIFAVTGSNGKTTVTGLTAHILCSAGLQAIPCGNYGTAFSEAVLESGGAGNFVVELSSFQLEHIRVFRPDFAALLNLTPDHLDRYPEVSDYYRAKMAIFRNMNQETPALLNGDDAVTGEYSRFFPPNVSWIGQNPEALIQVTAEALLYRGVVLIKASEMRLRGLHNLYNVAFSAGMAILAGIPEAQVRKGIVSFRPIAHRLEFLGEVGNISFYNDSKATNFDSVVKALSSFSSIRWIAGGRFKGGDFIELGAAGKGRVTGAYFIGESASLFQENLKDYFPCRVSGTLDQAVADAWRESVPGEVILLAPGCSSYDQFKNYEVRGDAFREMVNEIGNERNRG